MKTLNELLEKAIITDEEETINYSKGVDSFQRIHSFIYNHEFYESFAIIDLDNEENSVYITYGEDEFEMYSFIGECIGSGQSYAYNGARALKQMLDGVSNFKMVAFIMRDEDKI